MCTHPDCDRLPDQPHMGAPTECAGCVEAIEQAERLPAVRRPELGIATLVRIVARGTRAALAMRSRDPERCLGELLKHVEPMGPVDTTRSDPDTWARLGAVAGARDGWAGEPSRMPPDCPRGEAGAAYASAWYIAANMVTMIRMEVDRD